MTSQFQPHLSTNSLNAKQQRQNSVQEDFYLLDVVGGAQVVALHPTKPIVAYNAGCMIIVYDLMTDSKINLIHHQQELQALAFSPPGSANSVAGGDFLISIDYDKNDSNDQSNAYCGIMCLWNWSRGTCIQEVQIPKSSNISVLQGVGGNIRQGASPDSSPSKSMQRFIKIYFDKVGGLFFVLDSSSLDYGGGYRVSVWNLGRYQRLELVSQLELELQASSSGLALLSKSSVSSSSQHHPPQSQQTLYGQSRQASHALLNTNAIRFLTLEKNCIKIWEYSQSNAELQKKIHIKQNMKQLLVSDLTGFLFILGDNGKVLILDQDGEFVSTISKESQFYSAMGITQDKLLLGTERGTVSVYHLASLQFINDIPYQLAILSNFNLNNPKIIGHDSYYKSSPQKGQADEPTIFKQGPPVEQIGLTYNMRFLLIKYADSSFVVVDRTAATPSQAVLGYQYGHFEKIQGLQWMQKHSKRGKSKQLSYGGEVWSGLHQSSDCFVTCSSDMSIFIWKHFGDRWSFSYIDVVKCFEQTLSYQRKYSEKSTQNLRLTSLAIYPRQPLLVCGDNKGIIRVFQVNQDQALFIASHKLVKPLDDSLEDPIVDIYITQDEALAVIAFQSGLICVYDAKNTFHLLGVVEKDAQRFTYSNQLEIQFKVLEYPSKHEISKDYIFRQDEKPFLNTTLDSDYAGAGLNRGNSSQFRVLSTQSPNCVRLQSLEVKGNKLLKTQLVQFVIDEGRVQGFDVHPSGDYLLITSNKGRIYVYRIDTGELRGTISIPLHSKGCCIDPSGLYVLVQAPPFDFKHTANLVDERIRHDYLDENYQQFGQIGTNENDLGRTTLLMFEIGTGLAAAEIKGIFEIEQMKFSQDGRYLSLGSRQGSVCVWAIGEHLYQNIKQVLDTLVLQPDFWCNYPIFLGDYGTYGMQQSTPYQLLEEFQQVDRPEDFEEPYNIHDELLVSPQYSNQKTPHNYGQPVQQNQDFGGNVQNSLYQSSQRHNVYQPVVHDQTQQTQFERKQQQQQKFVRKTFVEDQFTQITPQQSYHQPNHSHSGGQKVGHQQSHRSAQIQTSSHQPGQQSFGQNLRQPSQNQGSHHGSPNKAEQLYRAAYTGKIPPTLQQASPLRQHKYDESLDPNLRQAGQIPRISPVKDQYAIPYVEYVPGSKNIVREQRDFHSEGRSARGSNQKNLHVEDRREEHLNNPVFPYQEVIPQMYNPFTGHIQQQNKLSNLYDTKKSGIPISSIAGSPGQHQYNSNQVGIVIGGRLIGNQSRDRSIVNDPNDIDDDVSDHGSDSLEHQLNQLDVKSKYLQNIRVPTRFAGDDFMTVHGSQGGEKAFTLARMRQDEQWLGGDIHESYRHGNESGIDDQDEDGHGGHLHQRRKMSNSSSTMNIVEEMYENMNDFDQKIKNDLYSRRSQNYY